MTGTAVFLLMRRHKRETAPENISLGQMQTIICEEIKNVRELVTVRKNFASVIPFAEDKKIPLLNVHMPGSDRKILIDYSGTIVCGCNLDEIRFEAGDNFDRRVKIIVPQSQILDLYADVKSFKIHHKHTGILAKDFKMEEQNELIAADLETQKQKALQEGILNRANENVRQMLMSIISKHSLNQSFNVQIVFQRNGDPTALNTRQNLLR